MSLKNIKKYLLVLALGILSGPSTYAMESSGAASARDYDDEQDLNANQINE